MFVLIPCELANTGSGNGLLSDGNKRLLKPMLTYRQHSHLAFILQ